MVVAELARVHLLLEGTDIVRPDHLEAGLLQSHAHEPNAGEEFGHTEARWPPGPDGNELIVRWRGCRHVHHNKVSFCLPYGALLRASRRGVRSLPLIIHRGGSMGAAPPAL